MLFRINHTLCEIRYFILSEANVLCYKGSLLFLRSVWAKEMIWFKAKNEFYALIPITDVVWNWNSQKRFWKLTEIVSLSSVRGGKNANVLSNFSQSMINYSMHFKFAFQINKIIARCGFAKEVLIGKNEKYQSHCAQNWQCYPIRQNSFSNNPPTPGY